MSAILVPDLTENFICVMIWSISFQKYKLKIVYTLKLRDWKTKRILNKLGIIIKPVKSITPYVPDHSIIYQIA